MGGNMRNPSCSSWHLCTHAGQDRQSDTNGPWTRPPGGSDEQHQLLAAAVRVPCTPFRWAKSQCQRECTVAGSSLQQQHLVTRACSSWLAPSRFFILNAASSPIHPVHLSQPNSHQHTVTQLADHHHAGRAPWAPSVHPAVTSPVRPSMPARLHSPMVHMSPSSSSAFLVPPRRRRRRRRRRQREAGRPPLADGGGVMARRRRQRGGEMHTRCRSPSPKQHFVARGRCLAMLVPALAYINGYGAGPVVLTITIGERGSHRAGWTWLPSRPGF